MTPLSEAQFQTHVLDAAKLYGWLTYHTHDSRRSAQGFPDLVLVREGVIFAELKRETGKPSVEQKVWLQALKDAGQEVYLWRPSDMDEIIRILRHRPHGIVL